MSIDLKKINTAYTHSGRFHADDVFSAALLRIINPEIRFIRVNQLPKNIENAIVFDIGGGEFDHHQPNALVRKDGTPYAAFGLLWRELGHLLVGSQYIEPIDEQFISRLDAVDNGIGNDNLSAAISVMNPLWNEEQDYNRAFEDAIGWASTILQRIIKKYNSKKEAEEEVRLALERSSDGIVILDRYVPYDEFLIPTEAVFVIYPSNRNGYNIAAIPQKLNSRENKISFPSDWCNAPNETLPELTKVKGFRFCHKNGFIAATDTKEEAVIVAKKAITLFYRGEYECKSN